MVQPTRWSPFFADGSDADWTIQGQRATAHSQVRFTTNKENPTCISILET